MEKSNGAFASPECTDYTAQLEGNSDKGFHCQSNCRRRDSCSSNQSQESNGSRSSLGSKLPGLRARGRRGSYQLNNDVNNVKSGAVAVAVASNTNYLKPPHTPPFLRRTIRPRNIQYSAKDASYASLTSTSISYSSFGSLPFSSSTSTSVSNWHLSTTTGSSSSNWSFRNEVMTVNIAQRSSSKEVKAMLTELAELTGSSPELVEQVEIQCGLVAQLAADAYYQVVISKYGGARILCHVMKHFAENASIQESCCAALQLMPHAPYLQETTEGVELLMQAMEHHTASIHVQSAASQALWGILQQQNGNAAEHLLPGQEERAALLELLERASQMFLTPTGVQSVRSLKQLLLSSEDQDDEE